MVAEDNAAVDHGGFVETEVTDRDVIAILLVVALTREADEWCGPELAVAWLMAGHDSLNIRLLAGESKSLPASENLRYLLAIGADLGLTTDDDEAGRRTLVVESLRLIAGRTDKLEQLSRAFRKFSVRFWNDTWVPRVEVLQLIIGYVDELPPEQWTDLMASEAADLLAAPGPLHE
ncbi:hypothetical protein [Frigoribacterium sp. CFBP 8751]|uniref:hypothetical protein n=1 Tax=Frigoribacterium sp. CFBP 8751 TaxID=2775277 RepID=UPI00177B9CDD|nr:hypothetical protein [Frigoribacterium sp. CFBP 8751]MBD8540616.1 hypothetical protein [Frigoribacterium sp. CFBP 8751]